MAFWLAGNVQTIVVSVNEVDIGVAGRAKKYGVTESASGRSVGCRILFAKIGFDFDDAGGEVGVRSFANQDLAEKLARDAARIAGEEFAG